jgi:hypothetical protein
MARATSADLTKSLRLTVEALRARSKEFLIKRCSELCVSAVKYFVLFAFYAVELLFLPGIWLCQKLILR